MPARYVCSVANTLRDGTPSISALSRSTTAFSVGLRVLKFTKVLVDGGILRRRLGQVLHGRFERSVTVAAPILDHHPEAAGGAETDHRRRLTDANVGTRNDREALAQVRGDLRRRLPALGSRTSNGSKIGHIWPELDWLLKPFAVHAGIRRRCRDTRRSQDDVEDPLHDRVRARQAAPGGNWIDMETCPGPARE